MVAVCAFPAVCDAEPVTTSLLALAALTVTERRSVLVALMVPSVTAIVADSASYSVMELVATPPVKVSAVVEPKLIAVLELLVAVGVVPPALGLAPENVRFLLPAYPVAVLPAASVAVT